MARTQPPQSGERFGRWLVTGKSFMSRGHRFVPCVCDCGTKQYVLVFSLRNGSSLSCGCWRRERSATIVSETRWKDSHGLSKHPLYLKWKRILRRCYNPKAHNYRWYGGRGIGMCEEWYNDAGAFIRYIEKELGPKPSPQHSLDRKNNDGDYEPGNLRWATPKEQAQNRRPRSR